LAEQLVAFPNPWLVKSPTRPLEDFIYRSFVDFLTIGTRLELKGASTRNQPKAG